MEEVILIVDQNKSFVKGLRYSLEQDSYKVEEVYTGKDAIDKIEKNTYKLILLDLVLPDENGLNICKEISKKYETPIIIITEKDEDINKILALEYGADDYLVKPFNILELKARIKAVLRRTNLSSNKNSISNRIVEIGDFTINTLGRKISIGDRYIDLTGKEFDLFFVLVSNPGRVFKREELLELVWGYSYFGDLRTVDVHIRRIRKKIEKDSSDAKYIMTKWGVGYYYDKRE